MESGKRPNTWRIGLDLNKSSNTAVLSQENFYKSSIDEVVLSDWFHLEALDDELWMLNVGDKQFNVRVTDEKVLLIDMTVE